MSLDDSGHIQRNELSRGLSDHGHVLNQLAWKLSQKFPSEQVAIHLDLSEGDELDDVSDCSLSFTIV